MTRDNLTVKELFCLYNRGAVTREELKVKVPEILEVIDNRYHAFISRATDFDPGVPPAYPCVAADNICTESLNTTCGSEMLLDYRSPFTASALDKARSSGFFLLGKTNLDEFGIGDCTGRSFFKTTFNPLSQDHLAGSGAAAVVAVGGAVAGFASDARGGLRQSASFCGLTGLKPTYGRVSRRGLIEYASSLDQVGVITAGVDDATFALRCISGPDSKDPASQESPPDQDSTASGFRVAVPEGWDRVSGLSAGVKSVFNKTLSLLAELKVEAAEVPFSYLPLVSITAAIIGATEAFSNLANYDGVRFGKRMSGDHLQDMYVKTRTAFFGRRVKEFLTFGAFVSSGGNYREYFLWAQQNRGAIQRRLMAILKDYDFLLLPTLPFTAPTLAESSGLVNGADVYTALANLAGLPAVTVPAGFDGRLPVGVQLIGRPFAEAALLKAAKLLEEQGGREVVAP